MSLVVRFFVFTRWVLFILSDLFVFAVLDVKYFHNQSIQLAAWLENLFNQSNQASLVLWVASMSGSGCSSVFCLVKTALEAQLRSMPSSAECQDAPYPTEGTPNSNYHWFITRFLTHNFLSFRRRISDFVADSHQWRIYRCNQLSRRICR
jgi:hypothetical protein